MIKRFDIVRIKSVSGVKWVSGPSGRPASPHGNWSVVAGIGDDMLLLSKDETIIQIPVRDVIKVADYSIDGVIDKIKAIKTLDDIEDFKLKPEGEDTNGYIEVEG